MILRAGPQDIAYDPRGLAGIILVYAASGIFVLSRTVETGVAVSSMILDVSVLIIFSAGCLSILRLTARTVQSLAALFGTGIIYHLLAWPVVELLSQGDITDSAKSTLTLLFLMLMSWQILVNAHIFRNAFAVNMVKAMVLSISYWLMSMTMSQMIIN